MTDWTLCDRQGHTFVFPPFTLKTDGFVRMWVKSGTNTESDLYWGRNRPIWNNVGDTATLQASDGEVIHVYPPPVESDA